MQRKKVVTIDLADENSFKPHTPLIADFINTHTTLSFIDRKKTYDHQSSSLQFKQNLTKILAESNGNQKFGVISDQPNTFVAKGTYSTLRELMASIEVHPTGTVQHTKVRNKVVKITDRKGAAIQTTPEERREKIKAMHIRERMFDHLQVDPLINAAHKDSGTKWYYVMDKFIGKNIDEAAFNFLSEQTVSTHVLLESLIIPLLTAYKEQIHDQGWVHRDIRPENINMAFNHSTEQQKSIVNFLDMDSCMKIGEQEPDTFGTPGFLAPEIYRSEDVTQLTVKTARDIFSLGVLLTGCIHPNLSINHLFSLYDANNENVLMVFDFLLSERMRGEAYDIDAWIKHENQLVDAELNALNTAIKATERSEEQEVLLEQAEELYARKYDLFEHLRELDYSDLIKAQQNAILAVIKQMTQVDPAKRPSIEEVIGLFKAISARLVCGDSLDETFDIKLSNEESDSENDQRKLRM